MPNKQWGLRKIASSGTITFPVAFDSQPIFLRYNQGTIRENITVAGASYSQLTNKSVYVVADGGLSEQSWISIGF